MNVYIGGAKDYSAMIGPAPEGFHIPLNEERIGLNTIMDGLGLTTGNNWRINLHMPFAGCRGYTNSYLYDQGSVGDYWSSSPSGASTPSYARHLNLDSSYVRENSRFPRAYGFSIRCFKNSFEKPVSSWTVIKGTLGGAGIFWNQSEGLISITDGTTGYTIKDKNLGATTVYNDGDTLTQANMGNMYQWGNNHGFPSIGSVTNSSTQVDASAYGPGNYYSSSTFRKGSEDWSSVQNDNLRGGVTGIISPVELKNDYIGEVWQPGANTFLYIPLNSVDTYNNVGGTAPLATKASGTITYSTKSSNIEVGNFSSAYVRYSTSTQILGNSFTIAFWTKLNSYSGTLVGMGQSGYSYYNRIYVSNGYVYFFDSSHTMQISTGWAFVWLKKTGNSITYGLWRKGSIGSGSITKTLTSSDVTFGDGISGAMSNIVVEQKEWSTTELNNYYNSTKDLYTL